MEPVQRQRALSAGPVNTVGRPLMAANVGARVEDDEERIDGCIRQIDVWIRRNGRIARWNY
jgi:hypothetical protein